METIEFKAGDIVQYEDGRIDYLVAIPEEEGCLFVNACNPKWIARGRREFCQELYPFGAFDRKCAKVIGHFGDGSCDSARSWYADNVENYRA